MIIVLGESIVLTGVTAGALELTPERVVAIVVAFIMTAILWWLYFDEVAERSSSTLAADAERQGRLARDAYTYLHIPIVAGVIIAAVANDLVIERPAAELAGPQLAVLAARPILYLLGQNLFRLRMTRTLWRLRMAAIALIAGVCFLGTGLPAVVTWSAVLAILVPVVVVETRARVKGATLIS